MATNTFKIPVRPDSDMYDSLGNLPVEIKVALREFIDNSYSSYVDKEIELVRAGINKCNININWDDEKIEIIDNAYGMCQDDIVRAFFLNGINKNAGERSRNEFGMGLKYASMALGHTLTIETAMFNSGIKYSATLDSIRLKNTKDEEIEGKEENCSKDIHGTKVIISNLKNNYKYSVFSNTKKNLSKLYKDLGAIYSNDLRTGIVSISINSIPVTCKEREYMTNDSTGSQEIVSVGGEFMYDGKKYEFKGRIGWLKNGSVSDAGISLNQKGRSVVSNYRPEEYFGLSNDARYQRLCGEIELIGGNWPISFTKNDFNWQGELKETFDKAWFGCDGVKELFKRAKDYKAREQNVSTLDLTKSSANDNLKRLSDSSKKKDKTNSESTVKASKPIDNSEKKQEESKKAIEPIVVPIPSPTSEETPSNSKVREFEYKGVNYSFEYIPKEDGDMIDKLFKLVHVKDNEYKIYLNTRVSIMKKFKTVESKDLIDNLISALVLGELATKSLGVDGTDIDKINSSFNEVLKNMGN